MGTFLQLLKKILGSKEERDMKQIKPILDKILAVYPQIDALSHDQLREASQKIKQRIADYVQKERDEKRELRAKLEDMNISPEEKEEIASKVDKLAIAKAVEIYKDRDEKVKTLTKSLENLTPEQKKETEASIATSKAYMDTAYAVLEYFNALDQLNESSSRTTRASDNRLQLLQEEVKLLEQVYNKYKEYNKYMSSEQAKAKTEQYFGYKTHIAMTPERIITAATITSGESGQLTAPFTQSVFLSRFSTISSARVMAVPLGASSLWMWCVSSIFTSYCSKPFIILAKYLFTAEKMATPIEKLEAQKRV